MTLVTLALSAVTSSITGLNFVPGDISASVDTAEGWRSNTLGEATTSGLR